MPCGKLVMKAETINTACHLTFGRLTGLLGSPKSIEVCQLIIHFSENNVENFI